MSLSRLERWTKDKVTVFAFIIAIMFLISILAISLYIWITQPSLFEVIKTQIGAFFGVTLSALAAIGTVGAKAAGYIRSFRDKVLFKGSNTMVSTNKGPKVLLWILDGCSVQAFLDVAMRNKDLRALYEGGYFAQCVTIFPSITPAAHSTIMTGCYPSKTRIPAFDWVEVEKDYYGAETREYVRCMPDFKRWREGASQKSTRERQKEFFKGLGDALELNQRYLSPIVYTIFETLGEDWYTISAKEWIHRGSDNFIGASINEVMQDLANKKIIEQESMVDLLGALYKEATYEFGDFLWGSQRKLADLMVYWKTGTDTKSHEFGPNSPHVREEVNEAVGKLAETLRFYKMNTNQPIYMIITADHSQSDVTAFSSLIEDFKKEMGTEYKVVEREDRAHPELVNGADIIVANNDRAAFFYSFGKSQVKDRIVNYLKARMEVDLVLYEDDGKIKVFQIVKNGSTGPEDIHVFFKDKEREYPNAVERIEGLMKGDKWGDVVVSMKEGYSLNPDFKPEKEGDKILHGDHGGLNFSDSIAPFLIWGPTIKRNEKDGDWETFRTVDIASTIARIFKVENAITDGNVLAVFSK